MVRRRADLFGLTKPVIEKVNPQGDVVIIEGIPYPARYANIHTKIAEKIEHQGLDSFLDETAYTWFNRLTAIRFMEINGFLSHPYRVLSNRDATKNEPEILERAAEIDLPGLDREKVIQLKLAGNKDAELYKMLLIAQCNELHRAMPFLFDRINDESEMLLSENLLQSDSPLREMVKAIDEEDWEQIEIIGWLYQFYISEKKDEVIGKTVKSEDIPAATQLFTPNWIVKYMTQNSLGRLWLEANPTSRLADEMEYFIQGVRDQGLGVREEKEVKQKEGGKEDGDSELSGFDCLAKGNGFGSDGLSSDEGISKGRTIRSDESGASGSGFDSVEHSRGTRTEIDGGVSQFSLDSERLTGGSPNPTNDRSTSELSHESTIESGSDITDRNRENAQQSNKQTKLGIRDQGLGFRNSESSSLNPNPQPLNPEELRILDPACGSGHILVEAYDLLRAIYLERGYRLRDIPMLILEKNLFGLDIDKRAVQLASFALLMKARNDDRRIFDKLGTRGKGLGIRDSETSSLTPNPLSLIPNVFIVPDSSELEFEADGIAEMFFSNAENRRAAPIRDDNYLFADMNPQQSLMVGDSANQPLTPNPQLLNKVSETNVVDLLELFENGKTYGSLIRIPHGFEPVVGAIAGLARTKAVSGNMNEQIAAKILKPFIEAAGILARKYDSVIANPPYMGGKGMNAELKAFAAKNFPDSKSDLFAMFIERNIELTKKNGFLGFMTPFVWMFLSSYEKLRSRLLSSETITSLVRPEYHAFFESAYVPICSFILFNGQSKTKGDFFDLTKFYGADLQPTKLLEAVTNPNCDWRFQASTADFEKIPGSPIAYSISNKIREAFDKGTSLGEVCRARRGLETGNNEKYIRNWFEISQKKFSQEILSLESINKQIRWVPYNKGGIARRWGNNTHLCVDWKNEGKSMTTNGKDVYFRSGITWSGLTSSAVTFRYSPSGHIFDSNKGPMMFPEKDQLSIILGFLNSNFIEIILSVLNPTLSTQNGDIDRLPFNDKNLKKNKINDVVEEAVSIARADWDSFETSWEFQSLPLLQGVRGQGLGVSEEGKEVFSNPQTLNPKPFSHSVEECWNDWKDLTEERINRMQELETENNRLFIEAYGLEDELVPEVPLEQITLMRADAEKDTRRLLSYFIACLMGRYSLDETGLIYADAENRGFDASNYQTFPADDDGIVPVTDIEWFPQEAARQFEKFIAIVYSENQNKEINRDEEDKRDKNNINSSIPSISSIPVNSSHAKNMQWIAEQLGGKANETPIETIRRYFSTSFFKDHLKTYKKRPIYWLFSSGKQKAFEALVYLHRYNEATLPRMRHAYVLPLMSKLEAQIETLAGRADEFGTRTDGLIDSADSTSEKNRLRKQLEVFSKKQIELKQFDEKLRHASDERIQIDLDDGVKVNYGKFGDVLAMSSQISPPAK